MDDHDKTRFAELMGGLALDKRHDLDKDWLSIAFEALKDLTIEQVSQAVMTAIREGGAFFPSCGELRAFVSGGGNAHLAWASVNKAIERHGGGASVNFEDKAINAAIRSMGGWETLCATPESEFNKFAFHRFEKAYKAFSGRTNAENGAPLLGRHGTRNRANGYALESDNENIYLGAAITVEADYELPKIEQHPEQEVLQDLTDQKRITE